MLSNALTLLLEILAVINMLFAFTVVFFEKRSPSVTWAWLMVVLLLPYVGFLVYLLLGLDSRKHTRFSLKAKQDEAYKRKISDKNLEGLTYYYNQKKHVDKKSYLRVDGAEHLVDLVYLNFVSGNGTYTKNNRIEIFHDGNEKFNALFEDIKNAKSFIHLLYYIFRGDNLGRKVIAELAKKAEQGVEVKLLIDGMGCWKTPSSFYDPLIKAGGEVAVFWPPQFVRLNFRNHRKICVIDGNVGYIGGINIGDEYLGKSKRFGFWRDTHIRIDGNATKDIEMRFIMDWNFCVKEEKLKIEPSNMYFPATENSTDGIPMQIVSGGPDTKWSSIYFGYSKMITDARKNIYIQTPYFVPDDNILQSLRIAALAGTDVRIVIPAHADHPFVYWASLSYLGELLAAGVRCYKYEKGFLHSKLLLIDGLASSTGTANMDVRSFNLNFEINAFMYDRTTCMAFEEKFLKDLDDCTEITQEIYTKRGRLSKIKESIARLLSPLL